MGANLKPLIAAIAVAVGLGGLLAVPAAAHEFHSEAERTVLTGELESALIYSIGIILTECESAQLTGTVESKTAAEVTVRPVYGGCTNNLYGPSTIVTNDCVYVFTGETKATEGGMEHAPVRIACASGQAIELKLPGCTVKVAAQEPALGATYVNGGEGSGRDVTVRTTIRGIAYTTSGLTCGSYATGEMKFTAAFTVRGYQNLGSPEKNAFTPSSYEEGKQVGIWVE